MIELIVKNKETVMEAVAVFPQFNLTAVLLETQLLCMQQRLAYMFGVYGGFDALPSFLQKVKDCSVYIVVYQNYFTLCRHHQRLDETVGIEYLAFEEHPFHRRLVCTHEEVYLLLVLRECGIYLQEVLLLLLNMCI